MVSNAWRCSGSSAEGSRGMPIIEIPESRPAAKIACPQAPFQSSQFERSATRAMDGDSLPQNIELFSLHLDPGVQGNAGEVAFGVAMLRTNPAATDGIIATIGIADACFTNSDIS